jgi:glycosyltransferase involved in cell wall biosynthesis
MKILMVLDADDGRGMFRHGCILAQELGKKGHDLVVARIDQDESVTEEDGVKIYKFAGYAQRAAFLYAQRSIRHHGPAPDGMAIKKLAKIIDSERPDLIHVHGWALYSVASLRKSTGIPVVATLHDYGYFCPTKLLLRNDKTLCQSPSLLACLKCAWMHYGPVKGVLTHYGVKRYSRLLKSGVDRFVAVSSYVRQSYITAGFPESKITVVPNFYRIEQNDFSMASGLRLPDNFILFVGTLSSEKGAEVLMEAYGKLDTDAKLVLIGLGQSDFNGEELENIIVLKNQPHDMVMRAWARCLFAVIPSICAEACPTVAFEAMACGKAIVASAVGGIKDIVVDDETGLLVEPGDADLLAAAMKQLLDSPALSESLGASGRRRVMKQYLSTEIADKLVNIYSDVIERGAI